ncbi:Tat pathway signal sequence domain protein [Streptomyces sp. NBC_01477]|uniref:Tat pathway signal sequence domain protein n=1 Tax=Streptomyces sp. NBC_01477 TaxID=2976015 RepID=UPI002E343C6D|nr:Tat pathway signal sequence domain protein [Streptomyces sp. NBC_01477]
MRRISFLVAALTAAFAAAVAPAVAATPTAAALPVLSQTVPGGPPVNPGDLLTSSLTPGTTLNFTTAPGGPVGLFCKQSSWRGQVLSNPPAPGTAVINLLNPVIIAGCFDNSPTVTGVTSVTVGNLPATMTVSDTSGYPIQILPSTGPLVIAYTVTTTGPTVTCVFQAGGPVNGNTGPGGAPWKFVNQPFKLASGSLPACGTSPTAFLTVQYSPVLDASTGGATVYVN